MRLLRVLTLAASVAGAAAHATVEQQYLDLKVRPQDDFYRYVNGTWLETTAIPPDLARYASFNQLQEDNWEKLHGLCDAAAAQPATGGAHQTVGDFYASGMNLPAIEQAGATPLQPEFARIAALQRPVDVLAELAHLRMLGVHAGFWFDAAADKRNSTVYIAEITQSGLGLAASDETRDADRDYYLKDDLKSQQLRDAYVAHIARTFQLLGDAPDVSENAAKRVLALETSLARASLSRVQLRDPEATYHKIPVNALADYFRPGEWEAYVAPTGAPRFTELNLAEPEFLKGFAEVLHQAPLEDWQAYLRWQLIRRTAEFLGERFVAEHDGFFRTAMTGATARPPRWKRVIETLDDSVGDALGQLYVERYFPPEAKARALELVAHVRAALRERLQTLPWMDAPTQAKAVAKLDAFTVKIGYPDTWKDYRSAEIRRDSFVLNVLRAAGYEARRDMAKIGRPVDKREWQMTAPTVNAYYSPTINGITFPAGILQPPFFDANADDAVNYGGIGVVIGHEMTHGFDDMGRKYDADGNLNDWWTPASATHFRERAQAIVAQFSGYVAIGDVHLNGELTQGENIADLGGLRVAYAALEQALATHPQPMLDGFTPEQRFFISHATVWRDLMRPEEALRRARVDPHSPGRYRVDGPLSNMDEFAAAFHVPEGAPMRRPAGERVIIW